VCVCVSAMSMRVESPHRPGLSGHPVSSVSSVSVASAGQSAVKRYTLTYTHIFHVACSQPLSNAVEHSLMIIWYVGMRGALVCEIGFNQS
jgi:hypothetical protein